MLQEIKIKLNKEQCDFLCTWEEKLSNSNGDCLAEFDYKDTLWLGTEVSPVHFFRSMKGLAGICHLKNREVAEFNVALIIESTNITCDGKCRLNLSFDFDEDDDCKFCFGDNIDEIFENQLI